MGQAFLRQFVTEDADLVVYLLLGVTCLVVSLFVSWLRGEMLAPPQQKPQTDLKPTQDQPDLGPYRTPQVPQEVQPELQPAILLPPEVCHPPQLASNTRQLLRAPGVIITVGEHDPSKCSVCKGSGLPAKVVVHTVVHGSHVLKAGTGCHQPATYNGGCSGGSVVLLPGSAKPQADTTPVGTMIVNTSTEDIEICDGKEWISTSRTKS